MKYLLFLALLITGRTLWSQNSVMDLSTRRLVQGQPSRETVRLFIKGDIANLRSDWTRYEAVQRLHSGNIVSIEIPKDRIAELALDPRIERIEYPVQTGTLMNDKMVINNNVWQVHEGLGSLPQPYTGNGVVMGYLDAGIEINHPDFRNADGSSRIKWLWDQVSGGEWTNSDIDLGLCPHVEPISHGSVVAGIGSGNGLGLNAMQGVATESDIIMVVVDQNQNFLSNVADGIQYCFDKADILGKPCVVNTSVGTYSGSHDGLDLTSQYIESLLDAQNGRVIVGAGGNAGLIPFHLGYDVTSDTNFTWFQYYAAANRVLFELWADEADFNNVDFAVGVFNNTNKTDRGQTAFINVIDDLNLDVSTTGTYSETIMAGPNQLGIVDVYGERSAGRYNIQVEITADSIAYYWSLMTTGSGHFDLWSGTSTTGTSNMVNTGLPTVGQYPNISFYKLPDLNQTMVSSWQCSDKVIAVANYNNRVQYLNFNGTVTTIAGQVNQDIATTSSRGPSRTGLTKPDVAATGNCVLSCGPKYLLDAYKNSNPTVLAQGGMHIRNGGTSMASPVVAGIAALILERYPNASYQQVKDAIIRTCRGDGFTGGLPNATWGNGKVHAYDALTIEVGCTDPIAANYNPFAQVDDSTCAYLRLGVDDPSSMTLLAVRPNPVADYVTVSYRLLSSESSVGIADFTGRLVSTVELNNTTGTVLLDVRDLDAGLYLINMFDNGVVAASEKLAIIR